MEQQKIVTQKKSQNDPPDFTKSAALAEAISFLKSEWNWKTPELSEVLHIPRSTLNAWISKNNIPVTKPLTPDIQAILNLLAIHKNLRAMFERKEHQILWLTKEHPDMNQAPYDLMKSSMEGLIGVRQYLDYVRGRGA